MVPIDRLRPAELISEPHRTERAAKVRRRERREEGRPEGERTKRRSGDEESGAESPRKGTRVDVLG